jgi:hypothetical protein
MIARLSHRHRTPRWHVLLAAMLVPLVLPSSTDAQQCENVPVNLITKNALWHQAPRAGRVCQVVEKSERVTIRL